ncbi:hypothetical protein [Mycobacterium avium]|uniref:hypothetical protein n=1 Tax=Mycobacterium avium TaxID=1764 RepID=UPI000A79EBB7|nr:hypothetical protein [Mycobacterium avium]
MHIVGLGGDVGQWPAVPVDCDVELIGDGARSMQPEASRCKRSESLGRSTHSSENDEC